MVTRLEKAFAGVLLAGLVYFVAMIVPFPGWWFSVQAITVHDTIEGQAVSMDYARRIERDFFGEWSVEIERVERGEWSSYCATPITRQQYKEYRSVPEIVTLEWFAYTNERCYRLPSGVYRVHAVWVINPGTPLRRTVEAYSNAFVVAPNV